MLPPKPRPTVIPAASAITFFTAPPISHPTTSGFVYTRNDEHISTCCRIDAVPGSASATTVAAGCPVTTSRAMFGPLSTPIEAGS